ncbi:unnamed protein product [Cunninghamella blakesleeana]
MLHHEIEITGTITCAVLLGYILEVPLAEKCLFISHGVGRDAYGKGINDIFFVTFWVIAFTFLRAALMAYLFHPMAKFLGVSPLSKRQRFAEQGFMLTYYSIFWALGMYIMYNGPHWFNTKHYWIDYPHMYISRITKNYYLMQMAFWFHQLYTIHIEKRRKDHFAMVTHHLITIILLTGSYYTNFTRIGNAVLCCMDLADVFLSLAKILKYIGLQTICDITFGLFAITWPITRHIFFTIIIWSTATEPSKYMDRAWDPENGKFLSPLVQWIYIGLFLLLNSIMVYWFIMIVRVVVAVVRGKNAEDTRSDDEDDEPVET